MSGRRPLKGGAPRLLTRHDGVEGAAFRRAYADLAEEFDLSSSFLRFEAGRVAALRCQLEFATRALVAAQRARRVGRGRRPNADKIERLSRRQGLADGSYSQGLARLEQLAPRARRPASIAAAVAAKKAQG
jgi:hypothetical protein